RLPAAPPRITHHQPRHRGAGGQGEGRRGFRHHTGLLRALRLPRPALADPGRRDPDADRAGPRARHQPAPARAPRRDQRGRRSARAPAPPGDRVEQRRAPTDRSALHRRPRPSCARRRRARPAPVHLQLARRRPRRARPPGSGPLVHHPARRRPMTAQTPLPAATPVGYPRIGPDRELKKAEEAYWAGRIDHAEFARRTRDLRRATRARLAALGLAAAAAAPASSSPYDQVLDAALAVGIVPERFASVLDADGAVDDDGLFALARGTAEQPPLEMTKWFDTNYHYLVPEIGPDTDLHLASARAVDLFTESLEDGAGTRPVLVGPLTLLLLAKAQDGAPAGFDPLDRLDDVVAVYAQLLSRLAAAGAPWVQLDEPALAADQRIAPAALAELLQRSVGRLAAGSDRPQLLVTTPYGGVGDLLPALLATGAEAVHVDLTRGHLPTVGQLAGVDSVQLVAGLVEGRSVWRTELPTAAARLAELRRRVTEAGGEADEIVVSTSVSLQHVPYTLERETSLPAQLAATLAFADEKITELAILAGDEVAPGSVDGPRPVPRTFEGASVQAVRERGAAVAAADAERADYAVRAEAQRRALGLPDLPTTTIGSFPQTPEVRRARAAHRRGTLDDAGYTQAMEDEIARVISLQEELGLDVLVHGEPERNDMVQYFAEHLEGFATTEHGWVQSYGSRCTRPSILFGDVHRSAPITVDWAAHAQSL